ncbi:MAG: hypothetical protein A2X36_16075 [Elusimicrobia bacterium GWA2_69_24]|nr:MAG: hypothetical protein A2X36_16075 [Elusimicrobia bacterium GWA2_69_24]
MAPKTPAFTPRLPPPAARRGLYFAFQGLLLSVLLLLFLFHHASVEGWVARLWFLLAATGGSLLFLQFAPERWLERWWVQMGLFIADAGLATLTLYWTGGNLDFYLLYFMIIFGTALTRSLTHSLVVAGMLSGLYILTCWDPVVGFGFDTAFWLRLNFLWVTTILLAILSRDTRQAQEDRTRHYQHHMIQLHSLATLGQVAGEIAHRIKAPLTTIRVNAEVLCHRPDTSPDARAELQEIQDEVEHCKTILKDLLSLGRIEETVFTKTDLRLPLRSALKALEARARSAGVALQVAEPETSMRVNGDQSLLHEAFLAVLVNAVDASRSGDRISVRAATESPRAWRRFLLPRRSVHRVTIEDEGCGIAPEDMDRLFEPFFTRKPGEGTGLGLSTALRILQKHGGSVSAHSDGPGTGAVFTFTIPAL